MQSRWAFAIGVVTIFALLLPGCAGWHNSERAYSPRYNPPRWADNAIPPQADCALAVELERTDGSNDVRHMPDEQTVFHADIDRTESIKESAYRLFTRYRKSVPSPSSGQNLIPCVLGTVRGSFTFADGVSLATLEEDYGTLRFHVRVDRNGWGGNWNGLPAPARMYFILRLDALPKDARRVRIEFNDADIDPVEFVPQEIRRPSQKNGGRDSGDSPVKPGPK